MYKTSLYQVLGMCGFKFICFVSVSVAACESRIANEQNV